MHIVKNIVFTKIIVLRRDKLKTRIYRILLFYMTNLKLRYFVTI